MSEENMKKTFTITTSPLLMNRLERFFALLHYNSKYGHSGYFGISLDGDGDEKININNINSDFKFQVDAIGGVGYSIEMAGDKGYYGFYIDNSDHVHYSTGAAAYLYRNGEAIKAIPSEDAIQFKKTTKETETE